MVKKRQGDFQKTKLRPGKMLTRGRNVTNTTFKAKKIIMPSQKRKERCDFTIQECIQKARSGAASSKVNYLNQLKNLMKEEEEFDTYLEDIFDSVTKLVMDSEDKIRTAALGVLEVVLDLGESSKVSSFVPILTNVLSCSMSHPDLKIKAISLKFLDILLNTHPNLICSSLDVLKNLKNLLSSPSCYAKTRHSLQKTNFLMSGGDALCNTQDWRIQVLAHMNSFLKAMLENMRGDDHSEEEEGDEIYFDGKTPLHIEIFCGGGLKPADIEKIRPSVFLNNDFEEVGTTWSFMSSLMELLSQILIEELSEGKGRDDDLLLRETINNLSILFEVLTHLAVWVELIGEKNSCMGDILKDSFTRELRDQVFDLVKFPFLPRGPVYDLKPHSQNQSQPCVRLNLAVCYLYSTFLLQDNDTSENLTEEAKNYLKNVLQMPYEIKYESIPMLLKILRRFLLLFKVSNAIITEDYLHGVLSDLVKVFKIDDDRPNRKLLMSFFMELSLTYGRDFFVYSDMLKNWFPQLIHLLLKWASSNKPVPKKILKDIQKVALRKHEHFLAPMEKIHSEPFQIMLTHRNEDISETAMFLLLHKKNVSVDLLFDLAQLILADPAFKEKRAHRLIRLLTSRFAEPSVCSEDRTNFIIFLLNIALDSGNLDERWLEYELLEFEQEWDTIKESLFFSILPDTEWKTHSELLETCLQCLNQFSCEIVSRICMGLIQEITEEKRTLPLHFVLAVFKLNKKLSMNKRYFLHLLDNLEYCTLFFLSVMSYVEIDDDWYKWTVHPIMKILKLDRGCLHLFLDNLESDNGLKTLKKSYHAVRIIKCFVQTCSIFQEDAEKIFQCLDFLKENCEESQLDRQPLYESVVSFMQTYFSY